MLPDNETITFEDQLYVNPEASLNEQNAFIDNLRGLQNQNNAEINTQTYNLGTAVPSNLGGLTGGEGYFTARYQTPQNVSLAADLRTVAQAQALNDILSNELAIQKQRYNNAYKAAAKRANTPNNPNGDPDSLRLPINTNTGNVSGSYSPASNKGAGYINVDEKGTYYLSADGKKRYNLRDWTQSDTDFGLGETYIKPKNIESGGVVNGQSNKQQYLYYPGAQSAGGGYYYPIVSIEDV